VGLVFQILINAGALWVAELVVEGITFTEAWWKLLLVGAVFSLVNTFLKPILRILTLPITILTLGLFLLVINAGMLLLTSLVSDQLALGFHVADFWAALLGALVIAIVGFLLSITVGAGRKAF